MFLCFTSGAHSCDWTGLWETDYGNMDLWQYDGEVVGTYGQDQGRIKGAVSSGTLIGTWSEAPTYSSPNDAGHTELNISQNCNNFIGRRRYNSAEDRASTWSGNRVFEDTNFGIDDADLFLGVVEGGEFVVLMPRQPLSSILRLTTIPMQAAQPPDSAEVDLTKYEGCAIVVLGRDGGGWVYSARVIDQAGPIFAAVLVQLFGDE